MMSSKKEIVSEGLLLDADISNKTGYKVYIPFKGVIDNPFIDYKLVGIITFASGRTKMHVGDMSWYLSELNILEIVKPLYGENEEIFDNEFRAIINSGILKPVYDEDNKETGEYLLDTYNFWTVKFDVEVLYRAVLEMDEDTLKVLSYMMVYSKKKEITPNMEYLCSGIGLKYTKKNKEHVQSILDYLVKTKALTVRSEKAIYYNKAYNKKFYKASSFLTEGLDHYKDAL